MRIKKNISFRKLTTLKVGGLARYYIEVENRKELVRACNFAKSQGLEILVVGGGSDILVGDNDFAGVVIKYTGQKLKIKNLGSRAEVTVEAGMPWDDLVKWTVDHNLQGIECLSGIPGTVGAAPVQNIGAYGQELKDTFVSLKAYDFRECSWVTFFKKDCQFGYRESIFKKPGIKGRYLISEITLRLKKNTPSPILYDSLKKYLVSQKKTQPTLLDVRRAILALRSQRLPDYRQIPNAGSYFKNPIVSRKKAEALRNKYPEMPYFVEDKKKVKLFAAWLIEKAGWKGRKYKNAQVSEQNALVITNPGGRASAGEIKELAEKISRDVKKIFGIKLEPEVQYLDFTQKVAILGYGLEGKDAEKYFQTRGAKITILDQKFDKNYLKNLNDFDLIVRSPGVYRYLPEIIAAEKAGVKITSAIKIFFENCPAKIIGVTGTKGKGTTATLIYEILKKAGKDVYLAGNIGKPYLKLLPVLNPQSYVVLELSSFQLIDLDRSPYLAVVLNITLDHLDWHKSKEEYVNAKKNIVAHQSARDFAVINEEYFSSKNFARITPAKVIFFSKKTLPEKYKKNLFLRGEHNLENIAAAVSVAKILKIADAKIIPVLTSFKGLEHRLELVANVRGVTFYNDSFATGPQPTIAAIRSFKEPLTLILGGSDKGLDYDELGREIAKAEQVKKVIIIGKVGPLIIRSLNKAKYRGAIINLRQKPMAKIVQNAFRNTPQGGVVLLSPAAASFDMFADYKDRGQQFKKAVWDLKDKK